MGALAQMCLDDPVTTLVGAASVAIVTDAVGFCRLAANRATMTDLDLHITGDSGRAAGVLAARPARRP